jgi:hypothetical protein
MTLNNDSYSGGPIIGEGRYTLKIVAVDRDGNTSDRTISFTVDKTAPAINIQGVSIGDRFKLNQKVVVNWSSDDELSGIDTSEGDIVSGEELDTETIGLHVLTFTASDKAGNITVKTVAYYVDYVFSGFLSPVRSDKASKAGSTIPVKFSLKDINGTYITDAVAKLYIAKITDGIAGTEFIAVSKSAASDDNLFRYDSTANQYIFNLSTKDLKAGEYKLRIELGDSTINIVTITLK